MRRDARGHEAERDVRALDSLTSQGWEPYAVTHAPEGALTHHLRRKALGM